MDEQERRRQLTQQAVSAAHWGFLLRAGAWTGAIIGFLIGCWVLASTDFSLRLFVPIVLALVGAYVGWRVVLSQWAR